MALHTTKAEASRYQGSLYLIYRNMAEFLEWEIDQSQGVYLHNTK